jgi:hypothetical protein
MQPLSLLSSLASQSLSLLLQSYCCDVYADHIPYVDNESVATPHLPRSSQQWAIRVKGFGGLPQPHAGD